MLGFSKYHHHQRFHLGFKENNENEILLFQLFGPLLFPAHVYGIFAAANARLTVSNDLFITWFHKLLFNEYSNFLKDCFFVVLFLEVE